MGQIQASTDADDPLATQDQAAELEELDLGDAPDGMDTGGSLM